MILIYDIYIDCMDDSDLKPDNILLDEDGHAHLSDFNIATQFNDKRPLRWSKAGSLAYMAPETLDKRGYSTSVDWWSLGIMAYELLFGKVNGRSDTMGKYAYQQPWIAPICRFNQ